MIRHIAFIIALLFAVPAYALNIGGSDSYNYRQSKDQYGFIAENTPMDEGRVVIPTRLVGATFIGNTIDTNFWTVTNLNNGSSTQGQACLTLSTGTTANGSTTVQSARRARYTGGSSNRFRGQIEFGDAGVANNVRRWGMFDGQDGAYFKLSGTTLSVCTIKGGMETAVASTDWNGTTTVPTITDVQSYEIYITNSKVYFVIAGTLVHTASFPDASWTNTTNLPVMFDNINSGGASGNQTMCVRVATIYRLGNLATQPTSKFQSGTTAGVVLKYGAGNLHGLVIGGVINNSNITLYDSTVSSGTVLFSTGAMAANTTPFSLEMHDIPFSTGLTVVVASANCNVMVAYE